MKFTTFLSTLALTLGSMATAQAEILIYKGTTRTVTDISSPLPKLSTFFEIVDTDNSTVASIALVMLGGKKVQLVSSPSPFSFTTAPLAGGRSVTTISFARANGGGNTDFENLIIHFRGLNISLKTSSSLGGALKTFPRVFVGLSVQDKSVLSEGTFIEQRTVVSYQQARSIAANDAQQTAQQVTDALSVELKTKGFQTP
jgi:hypothetical protein